MSKRGTSAVGEYYLTQLTKWTFKMIVQIIFFKPCLSRHKSFTLDTED